jgi:hypothetical protein
MVVNCDVFFPYSLARRNPMDMYVGQSEGVAIFNNATQGYCAVAFSDEDVEFALNCNYKHKVSNTKVLVKYMDTKDGYPYTLLFVHEEHRHSHYFKVRRGVH